MSLIGERAGRPFGRYFNEDEWNVDTLEDDNGKVHLRYRREGDPKVIVAGYESDVSSGSDGYVSVEPVLRGDKENLKENIEQEYGLELSDDDIKFLEPNKNGI
ncbi:MAG: hypothetical protein ABEJ83_00240 [Candidatus Nanohaloarchaea archaeon]